VSTPLTWPTYEKCTGCAVLGDDSLNMQWLRRQKFSFSETLTPCRVFYNRTVPQQVSNEHVPLPGHIYNIQCNDILLKQMERRLGFLALYASNIYNSFKTIWRSDLRDHNHPDVHPCPQYCTIRSSGIKIPPLQIIFWTQL
jgi:hypothetical protein